MSTDTRLDAMASAIEALQLQIQAVSASRSYDTDYANNGKRDANLKRLEVEVIGLRAELQAARDALAQRIAKAESAAITRSSLLQYLEPVVGEQVKAEKKLSERIDVSAAAVALEASRLRLAVSEDARVAREVLLGSISALVED